jgi:hypothetical protein
MSERRLLSLAAPTSCQFPSFGNNAQSSEGNALLKEREWQLGMKIIATIIKLHFIIIICVLIDVRGE